MIDAPTQALLQEALRRESRSELMYVGEAYPWTAAQGSASLEALRKLVGEEAEALAGVGRWLARRHVPPPYLGAFPSHFTTINFLALDYLLPRLRDHQRQAVAELARDVAAVHDPEARARLQSLLELKQRHLATLESLASSGPPPSAPANRAAAATH